MTPSKLVRCVLTDITALLTVLIVSFILTRGVHIPAAILLIQCLGIELLSQAFPISTLVHDKSKHTPRPGLHVKLEVIAFGLMAGLITYASYLLFFGYHVLNPEYIDTANSLYAQATTVAFVTLAFCQGINLLFVRADEHPHVLTDYLLSNPKLLKAFGVSLFLILNVVYNPALQTIFRTEALGITEWAATIVAAGLYALLRRLQRYTRKHTRHSVVKLHQELNR
jgi:Ca2+-transporting ATPase